MSTMSEMEYTRLLLAVRDNLGRDFDKLRSREELKGLINNLEVVVDRVSKLPKYSNEAGLCTDEAGLYTDGQITQAFQSVGRFLLTALKDEPEMDSFPNELKNKADYEYALKIAEKMVEKLPNQEQVDDRFFDILSKKFSEYKSSTDYMRRLVIRRLFAISPEFVCKKDGNGAVILNQDNKPELIDGINDKDENGNYAISTRLLILKQFIKQFGWCEGVIHDKDRYGEGYECETLHKKATKLAEQQNENGERTNIFLLLALSIEESIFEEFEYQTRPKKETEKRTGRGKVKENNNFRMLRVADSLAAASFGKKDATREDLYVFAIAFEMTFSPTVPDKESNQYETDIRKNLFFDYYSDNLVNGLGDSLQEKLVSGYGINYKNYVEIIYLYFLTRINPNLSALDRLVGARKMIDECRSSENALSEIDVKSSGVGTEQYKSFFAAYMNSNIETFKKMVIKNYACKKDTIEVSYSLDQVYSSKKLKDDFLADIHIAAKEIALEEYDESDNYDGSDDFNISDYAKNVELDLIEFFDFSDNIWHQIREVENTASGDVELENRIEELKAQISDKMSYMFRENDHIDYDEYNNSCFLRISSHGAETALHFNTRTSCRLCKELLEPIYHTEDITPNETKIFRDSHNTVSSFQFYNEFGKQIKASDFKKRVEESGFQIFDGETAMSTDELHRIISKRKDFAYKDGLMMTLGDFNERYSKLKAAIKRKDKKIIQSDYFRGDGTPFTLNELKKSKTLSLIKKKEYDGIYIFDNHGKPVSLDQIEEKKDILDKKYRIKSVSGEEKEVCVDEIAALFVYDQYGKPIIGYDADFLCGCRKFDDILKLATAYNNSRMGKNKRKIPLAVTRSELMIAACNWFIKNIGTEVLGVLESFDAFYRHFQSKAIFALNEKEYHGLNDILISCGYMEVNHKNLFDIILFYFTYKKAWEIYRLSLTKKT